MPSLPPPIFRIIYLSQLSGFGSPDLLDATGFATQLCCRNLRKIVGSLSAQEQLNFKPRCLSSDACEGFFSIVRQKKRGLRVHEFVLSSASSLFIQCSTLKSLRHLQTLRLCVPRKRKREGRTRATSPTQGRRRTTLRGSSTRGINIHTILCFLF